MMVIQLCPWSYVSVHVFFHWSVSLDKVTQKYIKPSLQFQHKQLCKNYKDAKIMDNVETKYYIIRF